MGRALLILAIAGCNFSAPGALDAGMRADGGSDPDGDPDPDPDATPDASVFDPSVCPATYSVTLPGFPGSRYRILPAGDSFQTYHTACKIAGMSHLIVIENALEASQLDAVLDQVPNPPNGSCYFAGAVQSRDQGAPNLGWRWLVGGTIAQELWGIFNGMQQPNDVDGTESNTENVTLFDATQGKMIDGPAPNSFGAVCECDGKAIVPAIEAEIP